MAQSEISSVSANCYMLSHFTRRVTGPSVEVFKPNATLARYVTLGRRLCIVQLLLHRLLECRAFHCQWLKLLSHPCISFSLSSIGQPQTRDQWHQICQRMAPLLMLSHFCIQLICHLGLLLSCVWLLAWLFVWLD